MRYIEVQIRVSPAGLEALTALLLGHGICGLVIDDPREIADLASRGNGLDWDYFDDALLAAGKAGADELGVSFYLEEGAEGARRLEDIKIDLMKLKGAEFDGDFGGALTLGRLCAESVLRCEDEWKDVWKRYFKPFRLTERLTVRPSFEEDAAPAAPDALVIRLDPGMAFGTGRHETTALCARLLEASVRPGASVLDIGCGSGILSIAAVLLGAREVLAVDLDDTAVAVARENIAANGCADRVRVVKGDLLAGCAFEADVAVANLTADLIATLVGGLRARLKAGGCFIASGILEEKRDGAVSALEAAGFRILECVPAGGWCAIKAV
ncbi:MAG: 50S ribosomal protein L11 methyltransferase [Clostridiales Family XIII bacterium]|jgi:ribosomal protein L11 methyltransferase|nr:50S ribosomal protein L11 methyltransferase [Clostridiales Family XIII bacterium]